MASQFDTYLEKNPEARDKPPDLVLEELYQTSGVDESFPEWAEKALRDEERPLGRAVPKEGKRGPVAPEEPPQKPLSDPEDPANQVVALPPEGGTPKREHIPTPPPAEHPKSEFDKAQELTAQPQVEKNRQAVSKAAELATGIPIEQIKKGLEGNLNEAEADEMYFNTILAGLGIAPGAVLGRFLKSARGAGEKIPVPDWLIGKQWKNKLTADYRDILNATKEQMDEIAAGIKKAEAEYDWESVGALEGEMKNLRDYWTRISSEKPPIEGDPIMSRVVPHPKGPDSAVIGTLGRQYTGKIDKYHPINQAVKMATGRYSGKHLIPEENDPYVLIRLTAGNLGKFEHMMKYGTFKFGTGEVVGPGLREIINPVRGDLDNAMRYAIAKRTLESHNQGFETGMPIQAAQTVVNTVEGRAAYEPRYAKVMKFQQQWTQFSRDILQYLVSSGVYSEKTAQQWTSNNLFYLPTHRLMPEYEGSVGSRGSRQGGTQPIKGREGSELEWLDPLESTVRNTQAFIQIAERNNVYFWLTRMAQEHNLPQVAERVTKSAVRPVEVSDSELNKFLVDYGVDVAAGESLTVFRPNFWRPAPNEIAVMNKGEKEIWRVDPAIVESLVGMDRAAVNDFVKLMAFPAKLLRAGATRSPDFPAANVWRDQISAMWNTNHGYGPWDMWRSIGDVIFADRSKTASLMEWMKNPGAGNFLVEPGNAYKEMMRAGGINANTVSMDEMRAQMARHGVMPMSEAEVAAWYAKSPLTVLQLWSNMTENATRLSGYMKARSRGASMQAAAYEDRELTVDFARNGAQMQAFNMITAFQNAQIQGVDRAIRGAVTNPMRAASVASMNFMANLYLWQANHDDPRYKNLQDYERHNNFIFLGTDWQQIPEDVSKNGWKKMAAGVPPLEQSRLKKLYPTRQADDGSVEYNDGPLANYFQSYRLRPKSADPNAPWEANMGAVIKLPMAWEIGVTFASAPIAALNKYVADNPSASRGITSALIGAYAPSFVPTAALAPLEVWSDYSFFMGRKITSRTLMDESPEFRYTTYSSEIGKKTAEAITKILPQNDLVTPVHIDHLVRGWTGSLGTYSLNLADWALRKAGIAQPATTAETRLSEMPGFRRFMANSPSYATGPVNEFYETYTQMQQDIKSYKTRVIRGQMDQAKEIEENNKFARVEGYTRAMSMIRRTIDATQRIPLRPDNAPATPNDPRLTAREKSSLIQEYYRQTVLIAQEGLSIMKGGQSKVPPPKKETRAMQVKDELLKIFANGNNAEQEMFIQRKPEGERWAYIPYMRKALQDRYLSRWRALPEDQQDAILGNMPSKLQQFFKDMPSDFGGKRSRPAPPPPAYDMQELLKPGDPNQPPPPSPTDTPDWMKKALGR